MSQPLATEQEIWIPLSPHTAARIRIAIVTEALPTPHETDHERPPQGGEIRRIGQLLQGLRFLQEKPF